MKRFSHIGTLFVVVGLCFLTGCGVSRIKDISLTSVEVMYVVPTSARSMDAKLLLGIDNPAMRFAVQDISGVIRYQDKVLAHFITGPLEIEGRTQQVYELPCSVRLDDGASLLEILVIASKGSLDGLKADVDIQAALKKNGALKAPYSFRDLDIKQFKN